MFIPSPFIASTVNRQTFYDEEGRMHSVHVGSAADGDGGIAEANSLYATDAEMFGTCAPFLKRAKIADAKRRNYIIQPGGACIYWEDPVQLKDLYNHGQVQFSTAPSERESFGHNSSPGPRPVAPNRPPFGGTFQDPFSK